MTALSHPLGLLVAVARPLAHDSSETEEDDIMSVSLSMIMFAPTSSSTLLAVSGTSSSSNNPGGFSPVATTSPRAEKGL